MDQKTVLKVVDFFHERLCERGINVSKIILFGSHASGVASGDSDIDIAVISEDFRGKSLMRRIKMLGDSELKTIKEFMVPMDILMMSPEDLESETSLIADYIKQGQIVYPRQSKRASNKKALVSSLR